MLCVMVFRAGTPAVGLWAFSHCRAPKPGTGLTHTWACTAMLQALHQCSKHLQQCWPALWQTMNGAGVGLSVPARSGCPAVTQSLCRHVHNLLLEDRCG